SSAPPTRAEIEDAMNRGRAAANYQEAVKAYSEALESARRAGDDHRQTLALVRLGGANLSMGQIETAENELESALRHVRMGWPNGAAETYRQEAAILEELGALNMQRGRNDLARQRMGEALAAYEFAGASTGRKPDDVGHQVVILTRLADFEA